ncbi:hypothetical protein K3495_g11093 [Podosphaera aphanis]|nr:hypothetical protein K3495_g11093 [Podosphaera aphanis]
MKAQSFHVVVFTLLFYISLCSSDRINVERIATREYAGYRCGTTFFPRKYVFGAASYAAHTVQVDDSPERKKINQYLQDQGFYESALGRSPNLYSWPIQNPHLSNPAAENLNIYFLVLGDKYELVGVVYRPTSKGDVFKCEKEMEISNVPDNPDYSVFGFRCPTKSMSLMHVKDAALNFHQNKFYQLRESDRGHFDSYWQNFHVKNLFDYTVQPPSTFRDDSMSHTENHISSTLRKDELLYTWPIDYMGHKSIYYRTQEQTTYQNINLAWQRLIKNSDFTFVVLGKDNREVGVVQKVNIMNKSRYVKCKLTASDRREPELIDSNLQQRPQKIDPQVEVDVFQCGFHYFKSVNALIFAAQASYEYRQRHDEGSMRRQRHDEGPMRRQFLSRFKSSYAGGSGRLYLWEVSLDRMQVDQYDPFSKIFKKHLIFLIIDDFSDVLGVVQMGENKQLEKCERKVVPLEIYKNYVEQLKKSN